MKETQEKRLGKLLDAVEKANKKDVKEVTSGHLNESKLRKPKSSPEGNIWQRAQAAPKIKDDSVSHGYLSGDNSGRMAHTLADFTLNSRNFFPKVRKKREGEITRTLDPTKVFVEELDTSHLKTAAEKIAITSKATKTWASVDNADENQSDLVRIDKGCPPSLKSSTRFPARNGVTKKDQYKNFKSFEVSFLRKYEASERRVLSGEQSIQHLVDKLETGLADLGQSSGAFHRLQVHSDVLEDLIGQSSVFGHTLSEVKRAYDAYVEWLLDNHPTQSHLLREQVTNLHDNRVTNPELLKKEQSRVQRLEMEANKQLAANDGLRKEASEQWELSAKSTTKDIVRRLPHEDQPLDLADQLEDLHATILEKIDAINEGKKKLREDYVPSTVIQQLEQCVKDTEVEIQRLMKQNELYERGIQDMEEDIQGAVREADTSDKDRTKMWEGICRVRVGGCRRPFTSFQEYSHFLSEIDGPNGFTNLYNPLQDGDSSGEDEEDSKWRWYIS